MTCGHQPRSSISNDAATAKMKTEMLTQSPKAASVVGMFCLELSVCLSGRMQGWRFRCFCCCWVHYVKVSVCVCVCICARDWKRGQNADQAAHVRIQVLADTKSAQCPSRLPANQITQSAGQSTHRNQLSGQDILRWGTSGHNLALFLFCFFVVDDGWDFFQYKNKSVPWKYYTLKIDK